MVLLGSGAKRKIEDVPTADSIKKIEKKTDKKKMKNSLISFTK
ncbi:MAG: hypothetical protein PF574_01960 [Candidatus Delongbacteria bacterium]|nr:hypothetical protein [Candidatus Delongbacteria bacterium]